MKRILITGGTGFLGGHLLLKAREAWEVFAVHRGATVNAPGVRWIRADLTDPDETAAAFSACRPDGLIHAAALGDIDACEARPDEARRINVEAPGRLAGLCRRHGCRMVFVSTDMTFDGGRGMYREEDETGPVNRYGETKVAAEKAVLAESPSAVVGRSALIYGSPALGGRSFTHAMLVRLAEGKPVTLFTDQFRTPVFVRNLADALLELAAGDFSGIFHLGGSRRLSRHEFGILAARAGGFPESLIRPGRMNDPPPPARRPADVSLNSSKAAAALKTRLIGPEVGVQYP